MCSSLPEVGAAHHRTFVRLITLAIHTSLVASEVCPVRPEVFGQWVFLRYATSTAETFEETTGMESSHTRTDSETNSVAETLSATVGAGSELGWEFGTLASFNAEYGHHAELSQSLSQEYSTAATFNDQTTHSVEYDPTKHRGLAAWAYVIRSPGNGNFRFKTKKFTWTEDHQIQPACTPDWCNLETPRGLCCSCKKPKKPTKDVVFYDDSVSCPKFECKNKKKVFKV